MQWIWTAVDSIGCKDCRQVPRHVSTTVDIKSPHEISEMPMKGRQIIHLVRQPHDYSRLADGRWICFSVSRKRAVEVDMHVRNTDRSMGKNVRNNDGAATDCGQWLHPIRAAAGAGAWNSANGLREPLEHGADPARSRIGSPLVQLQPSFFGTLCCVVGHPPG